MVHAANARFAAELWLKRGVGSRHGGIIIDASGNRIYAYVNMDTLAVDAGVVGGGLVDYATATQIGDWVKVVMVGRPQASGSSNVALPVVTTSPDGTYANRQYAGDNSSSMYFALACITETDYGMTFIDGPRNTTRSADTLNFYDPGFGAIASEGTLLWIMRSQFKSDLSGSNGIVQLGYNDDFNDPNGGCVQYFQFDGTQTIKARFFSGSSKQTNFETLNYGSWDAGETIAVCTSWGNSDLTFTMNEVEEETDDSPPFNMPINLDKLWIGNNYQSFPVDVGVSMLLVCTFDRVLTPAEQVQATGAALRSYLEGLAGV
jgi:hypothetical protein